MTAYSARRMAARWSLLPSLAIRREGSNGFATVRGLFRNRRMGHGLTGGAESMVRSRGRIVH
jgi:hypothetical protein